MSKLTDAISKVKPVASTSKSTVRQTKDKNQVKPSRSIKTVGQGVVRNFASADSSQDTWATISTNNGGFIRGNNISSISRTISGNFVNFDFVFTQSIERPYGVTVSGGGGVLDAFEVEAAHVSTACRISMPTFRAGAGIFLTFRATSGG